MKLQPYMRVWFRDDGMLVKFSFGDGSAVTYLVAK